MYTKVYCAESAAGHGEKRFRLFLRIVIRLSSLFISSGETKLQQHTATSTLYYTSYVEISRAAATYWPGKETSPFIILYRRYYIYTSVRDVIL